MNCGANYQRGHIPAKQTVEEQRWLDAAQHGEEWALEQFFQCYQPAVYALCYRLLGRAEDAEDATQAAFVRAFVALPKFRGGSQVKTWLYRIAVNEALGLLRKRGNAPVELDETLLAGMSGEAHESDTGAYRRAARPVRAETGTSSDIVPSASGKN